MIPDRDGITGRRWEARVGSLRGVEPPHKSVYYIANAVSLANRFLFMSRVLPWASIPADIIVDRYEEADGTASRIGQNMRVPLLRQGPVVTADQKNTLTGALTVFSILTMFNAFSVFWILVPPLGIYLGGFEVTPDAAPGGDTPDAEPGEEAKEGN